MVESTIEVVKLWKTIIVGLEKWIDHRNDRGLIEFDMISFLCQPKTL